MMLLIPSLLFALPAVLAQVHVPVAVSWEKERTDVFGLANVGIPGGDDERTVLWHKYFTQGGGWGPAGKLENLGALDVLSSYWPSVASWGPNRADIFAVDDNGAPWHKYWDGHNWQPHGKFEKLDNGKDITLSSGIASVSWGSDRIDLVAKNDDDKYVHLYWDGKSWNGWEEFASDFTFESAPSVVSWGEHRFDVFGVASNGSVMHLYWDGSQYVGWELLGWKAPDGGFYEYLTTSSWGEGSMDVWATTEHDTWHTFWRPGYYGPWEKLGDGGLLYSPQVSHWSEGRIDLVGWDIQKDKLKYKFYDGSQWLPNDSSWYTRSPKFSGPAALTTYGKGTLNILGIDNSSTLLWQMWNQSHWIPSSEEFIKLGSLDDLVLPQGTADDFHQEMRK